MAGEQVHQLGDLGVVQVGWCAAAPVHLGDWTLLSHQFGLQPHLALQPPQVLLGDVFATRDDLVARAVIADVVTERDVQVE